MDIIDMVFYGNSIKAWLVALGAVVFVFFAAKMLLLWVARRLKVTGDKETAYINDFIADLLRHKTKTILILIVSV